MEKRTGSKYIPKRGVERACAGLIESVRTQPYSDYMALASMCVGKDWDEKQRKNLIRSIELNLINSKEYPYELLQRKYNLPCGRKEFRAESRRYVQILSGLCGFE